MFDEILILSFSSLFPFPELGSTQLDTSVSFHPSSSLNRLPWVYFTKPSESWLGSLKDHFDYLIDFLTD